MPQDKLYTKFYRFKATSPSTVEELAKEGYGTISISISSDIITITSSGEFLNSVDIEDNQNSSSKWVDSNTIKFYPTASFGTLVGEIVEK